MKNKRQNKREKKQNPRADAVVEKMLLIKTIKENKSS